MNWTQVEGDWKAFKGRAREQWGQLTDDDLDVVQGQQETLIGRIQQRYGIEKEQARKQVDEWLRDL